MLASLDQSAPNLVITSVRTEELARLLSGEVTYPLPTWASNATAARLITKESIKRRAACCKTSAQVQARTYADTAPNVLTQKLNAMDFCATAAEQAMRCQTTGRYADVLILKIKTAPVSKLGGRESALQLWCFFKCFR